MENTKQEHKVPEFEEALPCKHMRLLKILYEFKDNFKNDHNAHGLVLGTGTTLIMSTVFPNNKMISGFLGLGVYLFLKFYMEKFGHSLP